LLENLDGAWEGWLTGEVPELGHGFTVGIREADDEILSAPDSATTARIENIRGSDEARARFLRLIGHLLMGAKEYPPSQGVSWSMIPRANDATNLIVQCCAHHEWLGPGYQFSARHLACRRFFQTLDHTG
jgi:hypothetical protein